MDSQDQRWTSRRLNFILRLIYTHRHRSTTPIRSSDRTVRNRAGNWPGFSRGSPLGDGPHYTCNRDVGFAPFLCVKVSWCGRLQLPLECAGDGVITSGASSPRCRSMDRDGAKKEGGKERKWKERKEGVEREDRWRKNGNSAALGVKAEDFINVRGAIRQPNLGV